MITLFMVSKCFVVRYCAEFGGSAAPHLADGRQHVWNKKIFIFGNDMWRDAFSLLWVTFCLLFRRSIHNLIIYFVNFRLWLNIKKPITRFSKWAKRFFELTPKFLKLANWIKTWNHAYLSSLFLKTSNITFYIASSMSNTSTFRGLRSSFHLWRWCSRFFISK